VDTKFFLYTKGTKGGSKELKDLLTFMEDTTLNNAVDEELLKIQEIVNQIKTDTDVKERYMTLQDVIDYEKRDSFNEGVELGVIQGTISTCKSFNLDKMEIQQRIKNQFELTEEKAEEYINQYW